jgi:hypothetical protein
LQCRSVLAGPGPATVAPLRACISPSPQRPDRLLPGDPSLTTARPDDHSAAHVICSHILKHRGKIPRVACGGLANHIPRVPPLEAFGRRPRASGSARDEAVILAIDEDRERALCQWHDTAGARKTQQFAVDELALAFDRGPPGGKLAATRRGQAARGEG